MSCVQYAPLHTYYSILERGKKWLARYINILVIDFEVDYPIDFA